MTQQLFERELQYQTMMAICKSMQKRGVMSEADVSSAENLLNEKYRPVFRTQ